MTSFYKDSFIVYTVIVLSIWTGYGLGTATECSREKLYQCQGLSVNYGVCGNWAHVVKCHDNFLKECTGKMDDVLENRVTQSLARLRARASVCPGFPDDSCLKEQVDHCVDMTHYTNINTDLTIHSPEGKKTYCPELRRVLPAARKCLEDVRSKCDDYYAHELINITSSRFDFEADICGNA